MLRGFFLCRFLFPCSAEVFRAYSLQRFFDLLLHLFIYFGSFPFYFIQLLNLRLREFGFYCYFLNVGVYFCNQWKIMEVEALPIYRTRKLRESLFNLSNKFVGQLFCFCVNLRASFFASPYVIQYG